MIFDQRVSNSYKMITRFNKIGLLVFLGLLVLIVTSCMPKTNYAEEEKAKIEDYLRTNPLLDFQKKPSGLYYLEKLTGAGPSPVEDDSVYIIYTGKLLNGSTFDTNVGTTDTTYFAVNRFIPGFKEGLTYMKKGGQSTLLIPSNLAYQEYTPLLFDVELRLTKPGPVK